jgi:hypothetical protein
VLAGCGGEEFERVDVSGSVTLDGAPVAAGKVLFTPGAMDGAGGANSLCLIRDGKYASAPGNGPSPGPYQVLITIVEAASSGPTADAADADGVEAEERVLGTVEKPVEISREADTHDFAITGSELIRPEPE